MLSNTLTDITSSIKSSLDAKLGKSDKASSASIADQVAWRNVSNIPSSFPPSDHRHNWSDIDGKPSIPSNPNSFIVASWRSGANWYRKYSDGFIEQGGAQTVTGAHGEYTMNLNIAFTSTNYTAFCNTYTSMQSNRESCGIKSKATSSFRYYTRTSENGVWRDWVAYGY